MTDPDAAGPWIKWAWRHYSLIMDEFDSYEDAISAAHYAADAGEESLDRIEGPDGVVDAAQVERDLGALSHRDWEAYKERPKATHYVKIAHPTSGEAAFYSSHMSAEDAEASAATLRPRFGERVKVVKAR